MLEKHHLEPSLTYQDYMKMAHELFEQGKTTSKYPHYNETWVLELTKLNFQRIQRIEKTTQVSEDIQKELEKLNKRWIWLVLVESWCGDVAQNLPTIHKIAEASKGKISLKLLLRDENLEVMDMFLTNGGRSIPKMICLDENLTILGTWGPRPAPVQELMLNAKAEGKTFDEIHDIVHGWYAKDKTQTLQKELLALIQSWSVL
jgi:thioredoxin-like negative regulator of GroEL